MFYILMFCLPSNVIMFPVSPQLVQVRDGSKNIITSPRYLHPSEKGRVHIQHIFLQAFLYFISLICFFYFGK